MSAKSVDGKQLSRTSEDRKARTITGLLDLRFVIQNFRDFAQGALYEHDVVVLVNGPLLIAVNLRDH